MPTYFIRFINNGNGKSWMSIFIKCFYIFRKHPNTARATSHAHTFGIIGSMYQADGKPIRYGDLVGVSGTDEPDGGPPYAARYITEDTDPYKIPSMELEKLIYNYDDFRFYLVKALAA